jgi:hypothetical protein
MEELVHRELLLNYQLTIEDIERAKQWQWKAFYYPLAAQAGVLAYSFQSSKPLPWWVKALFVLATIGLGAFSVAFLVDSARALENFRGRAVRYRELFNPMINEIRGPHGPRVLPWVFYVAIALSTSIVVATVIGFSS